MRRRWGRRLHHPSSSTLHGTRLVSRLHLPVQIGSENYPIGIYSTGGLKLSSSNWTVTGSLIALGNVDLGGSGTIGALAHLEQRVPPFLRGWPYFCYTQFPNGPSLATTPTPTATVEAGAGRQLAESIGASQVSVSILDITGRRVAELTGRRSSVHGDQPPAPIEFAWDGRTDSGALVPPGLYFARADGSPGVSARRLLVIR